MSTPNRTPDPRAAPSSPPPPPPPSCPALPHRRPAASRLQSPALARKRHPHPRRRLVPLGRPPRRMEERHPLPPEDVVLSKLPTNPPTGGWDHLESGCPTSGASGVGSPCIPVTLPSTVEQHLWSAFGHRPYTPEEYRYAADDPSPRTAHGSVSPGGTAPSISPSPSRENASSSTSAALTSAQRSTSTASSSATALWRSFPSSAT